MPLHVFEPRYRQMVQDLLDGPGRLVLGTLCDRRASGAGKSAAKQLASNVPPPILPIGGLGEILHHECMPDGRFYILVAGLARVHVKEAASDRLYRRVEIAPVHETPVCPTREPLFREKLTRALLQRCRDLDNVPQDIPLVQLADLLLLRMQLPQFAHEPLFCELDLEKRILGALAEHARRAIPDRSGTE
jgi:Lon protease-like protein